MVITKKGNKEGTTQVAHRVRPFLVAVRLDLEKITNDNKWDYGEYTLVIYKDFVKSDEKTNLSIESLLVDKIIKEGCTLKEAITKVNKENANLTRSAIYEASLNLKKIWY